MMFVARDAQGRVASVQCQGADTWAVRVGLFPENIAALLCREDARRLRDYLSETLAQADATDG